ncbi:MAG: hypothetical protein WDW36_005837 [Sanguina aurantia]
MEVSALITDLELLNYRERQREEALDSFLDAYVPVGEAGESVTQQRESASQSPSHGPIQVQHAAQPISRTEHQGYFGEKLNMVISAVKSYWYGGGTVSRPATPAPTTPNVMEPLHDTDDPRPKASHFNEDAGHHREAGSSEPERGATRTIACSNLAEDLPLEVKSELKDFQTQDHAFHGQQMGFHNSGALASVRH